MRVSRGDGSAKMVLADGVLLLHPEEAVFDAMLVGWDRQQRGGRNLKQKTIDDRIACVRRFFEYTNEYPWNWSAGHMDEWMTHLVSTHHRATSTIRNYQGSVRLFCDYITSPYYDWPEECLTRFATHPIQVCHEWNTLAHLVDYEGAADRRPLTREELQRVFDHADGQVERAVRLGRKGALAAYRDATVLKVIYGWGLRAREAARLDVADLLRNPEAPELGRFGALHVRYGKSIKGSVPRRRTVMSVMPWAAEALEDYVTNIRPLYAQAADKQALWLTERGGRLAPSEIDSRFAQYRDALGLEWALKVHCLRHSYVTHLIEDGADPTFVQQQVGHAYASTTATYTGVGGDFMNTMMRKVLDRNMGITREES